MPANPQDHMLQSEKVAIVRRAAAAMALAFCLTGAGYASEIKLVPPQEQDKPAIITISGEITSGDDKVFRQIAAEHSEAIVVLDSSGGMIAPALDIGRTIRLRGYRTAVLETARCASACALMWLAGSSRVIFEGGEVGFHASYLDSKGKKLETGLGNALVGHYLSQLGFSERVVIFATLAPPDKILWLNNETASSSGIDFKFFPAADKQLDPSNAISDLPPASIESHALSDNELPDQAAFEIFQKIRDSAERGGITDQYELATLHEYGEGVQQDYPKAFYWYRKSAEAGEPRAQNNLGIMFLKGNGVAQDPQQAYEWFRMAASSGVPEAQFNLGLLYESGKGVKKNLQNAARFYRMAADQGDADAQNSLGTLYEEGQGVKQSFEQAAYWYTKAAEKGQTEAQYNLGLLYLEGNGVEKSQDRSVFWINKSAEQGQVDAQYTLAGLYFKGSGVIKDEKVAAYWFESASKQGHLEAQVSIATLYSAGLGVPLDDAKAAFWYREAAEKGDASAQYSLGAMYRMGRGVPEDFRQAAFWLLEAANQGHAKAQGLLGLMYATGQGVEQDDVRALMWVSVAMAIGDDLAEEARELIIEGMGAGQISLAQSWARKCIMQDLKECQAIR